MTAEERCQLSSMACVSPLIVIPGNGILAGAKRARLIKDVPMDELNSTEELESYPQDCSPPVGR